MSTDISRPRASKACVICHKKKIRCDLDTVKGGERCTNCIKDSYECVPRERKRKRYSAYSPSPPRDGGIRTGTRTKATNRLTPIRNILLGISPAVEEQGSVATETTFKTENAHKDSVSSLQQRRRNTNNFSPTGASYLGRSEYIGAEVPIDDEPDAPQSSITTMSERDTEVLNIQQVWDLPPRSVRESLIDSFWAKCWPWTPIVERSWVEGRPHNEVSVLLLQGMLLAGSRVSSASRAVEGFYKKAKTLFWMGAEKDATIMCVSTCLLHWWNPQSPEHVSIDTSGFWLRISVGLAYQLGLHRDCPERGDCGLRRRLWWSIVVRDALISAGHGRPPAINLALADTQVPTLEDFEGDVTAYQVFTAYVGISMIMGDLTAYFMRSRPKERAIQPLEDRLFRWVNTLPERLQLYHPKPHAALRVYSFEARQMHVQYFTVLIIMHKTQPQSSSPSTAALLASSFVAGIMEEFLDRDEIRFLGPIFTFYLLVCGVAQMSAASQYAGLWHLAEQDLRVIFRAQEELAKRWPSAVGSLKSMSDVREAATRRPRLNAFPDNNLTDDQRQFFEGFGPDLCREWDVLYVNAGTDATHPVARDLVTAGILQDLRTPASVYGAGVQNEAPAPIDPSTNMQIPNAFANGAEANGMDPYGGIGNWLFNDFDGTMW